MSYRPRKALIIGAGVAGPVAAILLRRAGIESAIYEAWPYSKGIGGGLQIAPNGMQVMDEIGLSNELISRGSIAEAFDFYSQAGERLGSINRDMARRFGQPAVNVCRATLNEMLIDKAWCACVSLYFEKRLIKIEDRADQPIIAYFADGTTAEGDFLIGADGVHSVTRRQVVPGRAAAVRYRTDRLRRLRAARRPRRPADRPARRDHVRTERLLRLRLLQSRSERRRDVVEHATGARHGRGDVSRARPCNAEAAPARLPPRLAQSDPWHHRGSREHRGHRHARRRHPADLVAQALVADRRCRPCDQPPCRPGRLARAGGCDAPRPVDAARPGARRHLPGLPRPNGARARKRSSPWPAATATTSASSAPPARGSAIR
ncbi:2-polyprenyl-6-methoxyphenol hydroxylase-like FAD-dependent oxidoreductase [Bradyrhizobium sp. GM7.3]